MSQQAQNDYYKSDEEAAMDYAVAVNAEIRDLFAAGADIVQIDEPYMQARPEKARQFGLNALNRALEGITGTTAVHICFGYAAVIHVRPSGYSFLGELAGCSCARFQSRRRSQSRLLGAEDPARQDDHPRRDRLERHDSRNAGKSRRAHPPRPAFRRAGKPHRRARLRDEVLPREVAFEKLKAMVGGAKLVRAELGRTR